MPKGPLSPAREEDLLISRPDAEKRSLFTFVPGSNLLLDFDLAEATVSRNQDSLILSLKDGASVAIDNFFTDHHAPPSLALPDGTRVSANDFFADAGPKSGAAVTTAPAGNAEAEDVGKLENLFEDVSRVGGLGTLYWGRAPGVAREEAEPARSEHAASPLQVSAAPLYGHARGGAGLAGSERLDGKPGDHRPGQDRGDILLPGSDGVRDAVCPMDICQESGGGERPGPSFSSGGHDPFGGGGFNLQAFVRDNTSLREWTQNADGFRCVMDETFVAENAIDPRIAIAWSMAFDASKGPAALSDVTFALLFKLGPDGRLTYVDHKVVEFSGVDESGMPLAVSGSVSWSVDPGERYLTSLVVAGIGQDSGTVLVIDGMEYSYQTGQAEPVYDDSAVAAAFVEGSVFGDAHGSDGTLSEASSPAGEPAAHASGEPELSVTRFFLNGEWHAADDQAVRWMDEDGVCHAFRLDGHGKYSLETEGASAAPHHDSPPDLHVVYETAGKDGTETQAILSIAIPDHSSNGHNAEFSAASTGGESGAAHSGGESAWHDGAFAEGPLASDLHFSLSGNDRLSFENLLGERETLDHLLESGRIALSGQGDAFRLDIATESGEELHVNVSFQEDQLASFSAGYAEKHGSSEGLEQALLQMMLFGA